MVAAVRKAVLLTVLSFGGGQDSTAILYRLIFDPKFRKRYAPNDLLVIMADTGNEHPKTYLHVKYCEKLCKKHGIPFFLITSDMGFHTPSWLNLLHQYRKNSTCGSVSGKKSCTDNLKIKPFYKFLSWWVGQEYGYDLNNVSHQRRNLEGFAADHGKIDVLLGIARGEETRVDTKPESSYNVWMGLAIKRKYPLIDYGMDRMDCHEYIRSTGHQVPPPSNCMLCHFVTLVELLWLYRVYPDAYHDWVKIEKAKLKKFAHHGKKNLGVFGTLDTLPKKLLQAITKHGHMSDEQLYEYKMTHGHCISTAY